MEGKVYKCVYCGKEGPSEICEKCLSERNAERLKRETLFKVDGLMPLNIFRKFLLIAIARNLPSIINEYFSSKNLFPEIEGRIKIHALRREIIGSFEIKSGEIVDIIRAEKIEKITYKSRSKLTNLKWRSIHRDKGEVRGVATAWTLKNLLVAGANLNAFTIRPLIISNKKV
ncbi:MAG: hypothetical protein NDF55_05415 [archaeon GB-1867-005]|nr:hypothetical protein [Candidatus Culexmicrobium cathedralense]